MTGILPGETTGTCQGRPCVFGSRSVSRRGRRACPLSVLGYLVYRSGFLLRVLGILLAVSALGYVANSFTVFLFPEYAEALLVVFVIAALIGELPLTLWLLIKGVNAERWHKRSLEASSW